MADLTDQNAVKAIAELAAAGLKGLEPLPDTTGVLAAVVPSGWQQSVLDFEKYMAAPRRHVGTYVVNSVPSFIDMTNAFADATSRVYQWRQTHNGDKQTRVTAVINDHGTEQTGWGDFRVSLNLERDAMWTEFASMFDTALEQGAFAEFLEENARHIIAPTGATLLSMALNFQATRNADFSQAIRLQDGSVKLTFDDKTTPSVPIPEQITVRLRPYVQHDKEYDVTCRLRYRVSPTERRVKFTVIPLYLDDTLEQIHTDVIAMVKQGVALPIIAGLPRTV